jgi:cystathionine beta-synthase
VDALPVVGAPRDDLRVGEILGAVDVASLTDLLASGRARPTDAVLDHAGPALPKINVHATLAQAREALRTAPALMATHHGVVTGIITLHDLLARVARVAR